jgi:hypothetical protein
MCLFRFLQSWSSGNCNCVSISIMFPLHLPVRHPYVNNNYWCTEEALWNSGIQFNIAAMTSSPDISDMLSCLHSQLLAFHFIVLLELTFHSYVRDWIVFPQTYWRSHFVLLQSLCCFGVRVRHEKQYRAVEVESDEEREQLFLRFSK